MRHHTKFAISLLCVVAGFAASFSAAPKVAATAAPKEEELKAYAEWRQGDLLIVDGQRVRWRPKAKFKGSGPAKDFTSIPLGYEVNVKGVRQEDGVIIANQVEAKPNGSALFEGDAKAATNEMEAMWLKAGAVTEPDKDGKMVSMGKLHTSGADVDRVRGIVARLVPPYLKPSDFRVYTVENKDWNAFACANGMIVVYDSLLHATSDDEMAIVLGHELVHATHEHTRKQMKGGLKLSLPALAASAALSGKDSRTAQALGAGAMVTFSAIQSGYSREAEDQADRVGLRYAYEGKFDVRKGPSLWNRFAEKYGSQDAVTNFFFGDHSRAEARAKNLTREIALNYR
jgi:Zn-dependent protease with chaperone function